MGENIGCKYNLIVDYTSLPRQFLPDHLDLLFSRFSYAGYYLYNNISAIVNC